MQVQWTFEGCNDKSKNLCRTYWKKKQKRLDRVLSSISPGDKTLKITIYNCSDKVKPFELRGVLVLPGRTLAVQQTDTELNSGIDNFADKLVNSAKRYKEQSSNFIRQTRKHQTTDDLATAEPLLTWDFKADRKQSFFSTLRPLLSFLERHARRELTVYELKGVLPPNKIDASDVVNEVVLLAWERFAKRPDKISIETWLVQLLQEILSRVEWEHQLISLDQSFPLSEIDQSVSPDWYEEVLGYTEEYSLSDLIPDYDGKNAWDELSMFDRNHHVFNVLQLFPAIQRQAYLMHTVDDYSMEEISQIQNRETENVNQDILVSRNAMREYMDKVGMIEQTIKTI